MSLRRRSRAAAKSPPIRFGDTVEYALGVAREDGDAKKVAARHAAFVEKVKEIDKRISKPLPGVRAVLRFLRNPDLAAIEKSDSDAWLEARKNNSNLTFALDAPGAPQIVFELDEVREEVARAARQAQGEEGVCLISGARRSIGRLHPPFQGVRNAKSTGAKLVSFKLEPFRSYGKEQGANAPIAADLIFDYTAALRHLLRRDSRQKIQVGDATTIFWAHKKHALEEGLAAVFDAPDDERAQAVKSVFESPRVGGGGFESDLTPFYILGLSPNQSRVSVRFWSESTVARVADNVRRHFADIEIERPPNMPPHPSMFSLLRSLAVLQKSENIPPNLAGEMMRAILSGGGYPRAALLCAVNRCRAERKVGYYRAALLRGYVNRRLRGRSQPQPEISKMLDENNQSPGYCLGRLFAALESLQYKAKSEREGDNPRSFLRRGFDFAGDGFSQFAEIEPPSFGQNRQRGRDFFRPLVESDYRQSFRRAVAAASRYGIARAFSPWAITISGSSFFASAGAIPSPRIHKRETNNDRNNSAPARFRVDF